MRALAQAWPTPAIVQQAVAQLPWSHIVTLLDKLEEPDARNWYAAQSLEHGWSRNVLAMQIDTHAYSRAGTAITNFDARLPPRQSYLAREALKDPYVFDFLDACALSLPCHARDAAPVGLMLAAAPHRDDALLAIGQAVEAVLNTLR
jgi:Asp-tRNA(Asn)/Glu-tRNA(Gln) amidotransferase A subunit family amidase